MDAISHPDKVLFPDVGITKGELAEYYLTVADVMLPHLRGRPVTMERFPNGLGGTGFLQKNVAKGFPAWLERVNVPKKGGSVNYPLINDSRGLAWMANQNCITPHVWTSRAPKLWQPDILVVDLDPSVDQSEILRAAALRVRDVLAEMGVPTWVKTSGSKGYHIVAPLDGEADFDAVSTFTSFIGAELVRLDPEHLTLEFSKADRGDRIYVDVGRNGPSATVAAAYAVRARPGAPVSAPCTWQELERGEALPQSFTLRSLAGRVAQIGDLWADMYAAAVSLPPVGA